MLDKIRQSGWDRSKALAATVALVGSVGAISMVVLYPSVASAQGTQPATPPGSPIIYPSPSGSSKTIAYISPPKELIPYGKTLFEENCASCHGVLAQGSNRAPNLVGLGAATVDFWLSTGRMPLADPTVQAIIKPSRFTRNQEYAIDAFVASLAPGGPAIPSVNLALASVSAGESLFSTNCAACHTITGAGDALANNVFAPSLAPATPTQVAEAVRTGPGNMPRFGPGTLSDRQVADIVKYVGYLQNPNDRGGIALGHVGPVTEGFIAILVGLGSLMLIGLWIGGRAR